MNSAFPRRAIRCKCIPITIVTYENCQTALLQTSSCKLTGFQNQTIQHTYKYHDAHTTSQVLISQARELVIYRRMVLIAQAQWLTQQNDIRNMEVHRVPQSQKKQHLGQQSPISKLVPAANNTQPHCFDNTQSEGDRQSVRANRRESTRRARTEMRQVRRRVGVKV
jgi:hypothetical protein